MGGNALSKKSDRIATKEFHLLADTLIPQIQKMYPGKRIALIPSYFNKPDHGDMDILIESGDQYHPEKLAAALGATEHIVNGDCTSIGIHSNEAFFQVDLIKSPPAEFEFSLKYYSMNDLGNLLGRVAYKAGFRLGHKGLYYSLYEQLENGERSTEVIDKILVTQDWNSALDFLGFNSHQYDAGINGAFQELHDVFKYVASGRYFNPEIFLLENRNAAARVRDMKRKTYMEFLEWIRRPSNITYQFDWSEKKSIRSELLSSAFTLFPGFANEYQQSIATHQTKLLARSKFNGDIVSQITGLTQKDLGQLMQSIRSKFSDVNALNKWVVERSDHEIKNMIVDAANEVKPRSNSMRA